VALDLVEVSARAASFAERAAAGEVCHPRHRLSETLRECRIRLRERGIEKVLD
jgi:hypothetical protein